MDATQRAQLVDRIIGTWPNGPKGGVWTEAFDDHDEITFAQALDVYKHLRDTSERNNPPSIAAYLATWRNRHHRPPATTAPVDDGPEISFNQYIERLTRLAHAGNTDAADMLDVWTSNLARTPRGNV
jgi:hypothetical protein